MQTITKAALVLVGIVLGCGGAAVAPMAVSSAQTPGKWGCYRFMSLPDVADAAEEADYWTRGMNSVANSAPTGTLIKLDGDKIVCVKN